MNLKAIAIAAVGGFIAAFQTDLHAWLQSDGPFDWKKAVGRWVSGAVSGAAVAAGLGAAL